MANKAPVTRKKRDNDPMMDFPLKEILRESSVGLCVQIREQVVWVPRDQCEWNDRQISMPRSLALQNSLIVDLS